MTNNFLTPVRDFAQFGETLSGANVLRVKDISGALDAYLDQMIYEGELAISSSGKLSVSVAFMNLYANYAGAHHPIKAWVIEVQHTGNWTDYSAAAFTNLEDAINNCVSSQQLVSVKSIRELNLKVHIDNGTRVIHTMTGTIKTSKFTSQEHRPSDEQLHTRIALVVAHCPVSTDMAGVLIKEFNTTIRRLKQSDL